MSNENIDESNFKRCSREALQSYSKKNMMVDMLFWRHILMYYEREIKILKIQRDQLLKPKEILKSDKELKNLMKVDVN